MRLRSRRARSAALVGLVLLIAGATAVTPRALRDVDAFRVQRVEVSGTRFLDAYAVVRAAGLGAGSSTFDDPAAWRLGVLTLPLVESVEVERTLPDLVKVRITEVEPVALVAAGNLRPVDAAGWLLPLDPAGSLLDLPILTGADVRGGRIVERAGGGVLHTLIALRTGAPELADRVSQLEQRSTGVRVVFRDEPAEALLPIAPTDVQVRQLRLAYADLAGRGELGKVRRIDLRFRDQVVVSFLTSPVS